MSETTKNTESSKKMADHAARSAQGSVESAAKATKDSMDDTGKMDGTGKMASHAADRAVETSQGMTETAAQAADQSREAMLMGARAVANIGGKVADINFGRGHHIMSSAAHAMDIYRDAAERSAGRVQALMSSAMTLGRGMTSMQHAWFEMVDRSMESAAHKPRDLLRCKTMVELAEVQRDLYLDAINHAFESTNRLLELAGRTAQDAVRPLRS